MVVNKVRNPNKFILREVGCKRCFRKIYPPEEYCEGCKFTIEIEKDDKRRLGKAYRNEEK